jgi:hypothetical protein
MARSNFKSFRERVFYRLTLSLDAAIEKTHA